MGQLLKDKKIYSYSNEWSRFQVEIETNKWAFFQASMQASACWARASCQLRCQISAVIANSMWKKWAKRVRTVTHFYIGVLNTFVARIWLFRPGYLITNIHEARSVTLFLVNSGNISSSHNATARFRVRDNSRHLI